MKIVSKIIAVMTICFVIATIGISIIVYNSSSDIEDPTIEFSMDKDARTLTVEDIKNFNLNWEDISVSTGDAILPSSGEVKVNDVISNCYGTIEFMIKDTSFGGWIFNERPVEHYEDARFIGNWGGEDNQEFIFYDDGTYFNSFDPLDFTNATPDDEYQIKKGKYEAIDDELILDEIEADVALGYTCYATFSADDTKLILACPPLDITYNLERSFTTELYQTIFNVSEKLDPCLSFFISNYSNETHEDILSEGLNLNVTFTEEPSQEIINNLTEKGIVFNTDPEGNYNHTGLNYSIQIDSLHDLYYLVSRVDVKFISATDPKFNDFGCSIDIS